MIRTMTEAPAAGFVTAVGIGCLLWSLPVSAAVQASGSLGTVEISGFARVQADLHTANRNPNNDLPDNNRVQLFRQWLLADVTWQTPLRNLKLYTRARLWSDQTAAVDGAIPAYDSFPTEFDGDEWLLRASNDRYAAELWELWADYTIGDLYLRVGRQTIVWGDTAPSRLLDDTNPLDLSWHLLFEPLGKEAFDHLRIPLHAARASYSLPFLVDYQLEGYVIPGFSYISTQLPDRNSPLNVISLPAPLELREDKIDDGQRGVGAGVRLLGRLGGLSYTLNWITRHLADPLAQVRQCRLTLPPIDTEIDCDTVFGLVQMFPDLPPPPGVRVLLDLRHPRMHTVGFSANYFEQWTNIVTRIEATWDIDRPFENLESFNTEIVERNQWNFVVTIDRPTFLLRRDRSAYIIVQFEQRFREGGREKIGYIGESVDRNDELFTLLFEQAFNNPVTGNRDEFVFNLASLYSTDNTYILQPLVRFEPGNHWRFNVWYNLILGSEDRPLTTTTQGRFSFVEFAQGLNLSLSYQF